MDHRLLCVSFSPPPPTRMDAYLDQVTVGLVKDIDRLSIFSLDRAIEMIRAKPSLTEQAALLNALEERMIVYGRARGYLNPPHEKALDERADVVTTFLIKDVFGFGAVSATDKAISEFKKLLKEFIKSGLNSKGAATFKFLQTMWKLCNAKNPRDAAAILMREGGTALSTWLKFNFSRYAGLTLRAAGVSPVVRNRLLKLIAARLAWGETILARLAWVSPWLIALDIFFTPQTTATDAEEARLAFLTIYGRLFAARDEFLGKLVKSCSGETWHLSMPIEEALEIAIIRAH